MTVIDRDLTGDAATTGRAHDRAVGAADHTEHGTARQALHNQRRNNGRTTQGGAGDGDGAAPTTLETLETLTAPVPPRGRPRAPRPYSATIAAMRSGS